MPRSTLILIALLVAALSLLPLAAETVATPVLTPGTGTYNTPQTVYTSCATDSVVIRYTENNSEPNADSPVFPVLGLEVNQSKTMKAKAFRTGWTPSATATAIYTLQAATPSFSISGGTYNTPQTVAITCTSPGVTIRYTTNGSEPAESSAQYATPISVTQTTTLKAKAYRTGWTASTTASATYTLQAATPTFSPEAGTFYNTLSVSINCASPGVTIRYTTNGATPTSSSTLYTIPISISQTTTLKAKAFRNGWTDSQVATAVYTLQVADPVFDPAAGTYNANQYVTITTVTEGDTIRYTTNGSNPTESSPIYTSPVSISGTTTLKAKAFKFGWPASGVTSGNYILKPVTPVISPSGGTFVEIANHTISITCATTGTQIRYTLDGTEPTETTGSMYSGSFTIDRNRTVKARAFKSGWTGSDTAQATIYLKAHIPTINPTAGTYTVESGLQITLDCATTTATIRYTTNGDDPTSSSTAYTDPFNITQSCTLKARAFKANWTESDISSQVYALKAFAPTISPDPGTYTAVSGLSITLACTTTGATIRYTTDGTDPTASSSAYSAPFNINQNCTVKARAFKTNWTASDVSSQAYQLRVSTPLITPSGGTFVEVEGHQVTFSCPTPDVTIRYTTNGADPTASSPAAPAGGITINQTTTVKARAFRTNWLDSAVDTSVITLQAMAPVTDTPPDVYNSVQNITLSSGTVNTTLRYTLDFSDPTSDSPEVPVGGITINQNTTVKARAFRNNWTTSDVSIFTYTLMTATPVFSPPAGQYDSPQQVIISSSTPGVQIRYTTDGSDPGPGSALYESPVQVGENTLLKARAYKPGWTRSELGSAAYTFIVATPAFAPPGGVFPQAQQVVISCYTPSAEIRYTTDGSDPGTISDLYESPITIAQTTLLKARAFKVGHSPSQVSMAQYTINGQVTFFAPAFSPDAGIYSTPQMVAITGITFPAGASIRYTLDGSEPNAASTLYAGPIQIIADTTIKARAFLANWSPSELQSASYVITGQLLPEVFFDPPAGLYTQSQSISISALGLPVGCALRYTLDGSLPDANSSLYNLPVSLPLNSQTTIKVRAFKENWEPSPVHSASYSVTGTVLLPQVVFTPPPGNYAEELFIGIQGLPWPADALLRYTLDGSDPGPDSPSCPAVIQLEPGSELTIKVAALRDDWIPSQVHSAFYRVLAYSAQVNVDANYVFAGISSGDYQLVGLPGMLSHPLSLYLQGEYGTAWKAFGEPGNGQELVPWTSGNNLAFSPGIGYWLLSTNPVQVSIPGVASVPLDGDLGFAIPIHPGWNIISNPFTKTIPWQVVKAANSTPDFTLVDDLNAFQNGVWNDAENLEANQGYYFFNRRQDATLLQIPWFWEELDPPERSEAPGCTVELMSDQASQPLKVGISPLAEDGLDDLDLFAPPLTFCGEYVRLENGQLKQDFRHTPDQVFNFSVHADWSEQPSLHLSLAEGSPCFYLWDKADDSIHPVHGALVYPLPPCHNNFALVTGSAQYLQNLRDNLMPQANVVANNRPNPFHGFTSIKAGFAAETRVSVEVYNLRGQRVALLADNVPVAAGSAEWTFDATSLAAGIYFCRVSWNNGQTKGQQTLRMVHVK